MRLDRDRHGAADAEAACSCNGRPIGSTACPTPLVATTVPCQQHASSASHSHTVSSLPHPSATTRRRRGGVMDGAGCSCSGSKRFSNRHSNIATTPLPWRIGMNTSHLYEFAAVSSLSIPRAPHYQRETFVFRLFFFLPFWAQPDHCEQRPARAIAAPTIDPHASPHPAMLRAAAWIMCCCIMVAAVTHTMTVNAAADAETADPGSVQRSQPTAMHTHAHTLPPPTRTCITVQCGVIAVHSNESRVARACTCAVSEAPSV